MAIVKEVDDLVKKMKDNVKKMQEMMNLWKKPIFERKNKPLLPEDVENAHSSALQPRFEDVKSQGKEIHKAIKDTADAIKPDKKSENWMAYVDYCNGLVIEGITKGIQCSMSYLSEQINIQFNKQSGLQPIFDIKVDLRDREVKFEPPIESCQRGNGIRDIIMKITNDFISLAIQMPRLDTGNGDYLVEIKDQFELFGALQILTNNLNEIEDATGNFIHQYKDLEFLWRETLAENFAAFLE
jgi:dynein heavy chain